MSVNENDQDADFARALRHTADSFEPPALTAIHDGAVAHGRRMRRTSAIGAGLSVVAVIGVAGTAAAALAGPSTHAGKTQSAAATDRSGNGNGTPVAAPDTTTLATPRTATSPTSQPAGSDETLKKDFLATLPAGIHVADVQGNDHQLTWNWAANPSGPGATLTVWHPATPTTCQYFMEIAKEKTNSTPECNATNVPGGGSLVIEQSQAKTALPTPLYESTYDYVRADGVEISIYQLQYNTAASPITPQEASTMLTSPVWDSVAAHSAAKS